MKKILSIFLVITMLIATCTVATAYYTDIDGHWAEKEINAWSDYGVISGYDGKFSPNRYITRGEFAVVLNRLMNYQKESENTFKDLPDKFYTSSVLKLSKATVMQGYDGYITPENSLTREEASVMICRALGIKTADKMNRAFSDEADISSWSKAYINAMVNKGLLNGADGKLNPKNPIMRCEVVKILDNAVYPILKSGTFESVNTDKIVVISAGDVAVNNSEIKGKIIVTQGATDGKVSFTNSKLENDFIIDNDRDSFIEIEGTIVKNEDIIKDNESADDKKEESESSGGNSGSSEGGNSGNQDESTENNAGKPIKVTFFEGYGDYAYEFDEVELILDAKGKASVSASDIPSTDYPWLGYEKKEYMPSSYEDYRGKHEVIPGFWYLNNGEWKEFDESVILTKDTEVYMLFKTLSVSALGTAVEVRYNENSRKIDSAITFVDGAIEQLETAQGMGLQLYDELTSTFLGMLTNSDITDDDGYVKAINIDIEFANSEELQTLTFDEVLELESGEALASMVSLVGYDVCKKAFDDAKAGATSTRLTVAFDLIEDIFEPIYKEAEEIVIDEFDESICYDENPYLQYLVEELDMFDELFELNRNGYKVKEITDYFSFLAKLLIGSSDTLYWYEDVAGVRTDRVVDAIFAKVDAVNERIDEALTDPQYENLPNRVKKALESVKLINVMLMNIKPVLSEDMDIETEFGDLIDSGELDSLIDQLKDIQVGGMLDRNALNDIVEIVENIAENGTEYYKVSTTDKTDRSKYKVSIGDIEIIVKKYLEF